LQWLGIFTTSCRLCPHPSLRLILWPQLYPQT
jgi:hypothetical protein